MGGTTLGVLTAAKRIRSPLLTQFAIQTVAWGTVVGTIAGLSWRSAGLRDVAGASRLERLLWMRIGLDVGYVAVGAVLAIAAWRFARRMGGVGAGTSIVVQGLALLVLDLQFASTVSR